MSPKPAPVYPTDYLVAAAIPYGSLNPVTGRPHRPGTRSLTADSPAAPAYAPKRPTVPHAGQCDPEFSRFIDAWHGEDPAVTIDELIARYL